MITPADLDQLILQNETEHLEFKEANNRYDFEKLVQYCVALANEGGGQFVLGVSDKPPRRVVGTASFENPSRTAGGLYERLNLKVTVDTVIHPDGRVLVFNIPSRPTGQPVHYEGRYFMRAGDELVPMSPDALKAVFAEGSVDWVQEPAREGCTSEEVVSLLDTQVYFDLLELSYPAGREAVLDRFAREKLITANGQFWTITNLGAVLFAKRLDVFDSVQSKGTRVIVYEGPGKLQTKTDQHGNKGYAVGFEGLLQFINGLVPSNELIEQALRSETKMFPELAIREIVANALVHQDFRAAGGGVMIEIYPDRLEVSNPGVPSISLDRFIDEYQSRNERLAALMRRLRICEEEGSGIDKVVQAAETFQLPAPDFRVNTRRTSVLLFAHRDFDAMDRDERIRAAYQHCCLRWVTNQRMTNQSLRERFELSAGKSESVSRIIRDSVASGRIKLADPSQKGFKYRSYLPFWA